MTEGMKPPHGSILWTDLTVPDATELRDFYKSVVGWDADGAQMDGYEDFNMKPGGATEAIAGICHARGGNSEIPACWMIYITVPDVDAAAEQCKALGGKVLLGPKGESGRTCVIQDPAGAICALYETD